MLEASRRRPSLLGFKVPAHKRLWARSQARQPSRVSDGMGSDGDDGCNHDDGNGGRRLGQAREAREARAKVAAKVAARARRAKARALACAAAEP